MATSVKATSTIVFVTVFCMSLLTASAQGFKCGDSLIIKHAETGANLHSHSLKYSHPGSSGQQQVTALKSSDLNDVWVIEDCADDPVQNKSRIRLRHLATKMYLHSHAGKPAPMTPSQQEVTGWQGKDANDLWEVQVEGGGVWSQGKKIRLVHVQTNAALHSHNIVGGAIPVNQQEVTAYSGRDNNDFWLAQYALNTPPEGAQPPQQVLPITIPHNWRPPVYVPEFIDNTIPYWGFAVFQPGHTYIRYNLINISQWKLTQEMMILTRVHEYGHIVLKSSDEGQVDCWAAKQLAATDPGILDSAITWLNNVMGNQGGGYGAGTGRQKAAWMRKCQAG